MSGEMSFRHRWVLRVGRDRGVSEGARLLGIVAINEFGRPSEGSEFWPSHKALAELIGVSERTAERRMNELAAAGLIQKRSGGFQGSNHYVATIPNTDSGDGIEAPNTDNCDANPDTGDGPIPTVVSDEQTHEHSHTNIPTPSSSPAEDGEPPLTDEERAWLDSLLSEDEDEITKPPAEPSAGAAMASIPRQRQGEHDYAFTKRMDEFLAKHDTVKAGIARGEWTTKTGDLYRVTNVEDIPSIAVEVGGNLLAPIGGIEVINPPAGWLNLYLAGEVLPPLPR